MLIETPYKVNDVVSLKLSSGEEIEKLIDWKIELLKKTRMYVSGEYKYILSDKKLEKEINRWRHTR